MERILFFVRNSCPDCVRIKKLAIMSAFLEDKNVECINVDDSDENMEKAKNYFVNSVPTLLYGDTLFCGYNEIVKFLMEMI